jgi:DNA-binding transcriptional LysR family regulator
VVGRPILERQGRTMRFTPDGETLLAEARVIVSAHDDALDRLGIGAADATSFGIGSTEHAADHLLPAINSAVAMHFPDVRVTFRLDRGSSLVDALGRGTLDVALLIGDSRTPDSAYVADLPLSWYAAPGWIAPLPSKALPIVVIDDPCTIRRKALRTLAEANRRSVITGEAGHLAGVLNAARAGVGVALLAHLGPPPEGLEQRFDLPPAEPEPLHLSARRDSSARLVAVISTSVRAALTPV